MEQNRAVPGAGLYKPYQSDVFNVDNGYDYLLAQGYIGFNVTRHVGVQFGHGRNFIGQGYRSMLLSDFATDYLYLKINTRVWKLHYQNIFAELNAFGTRDESRVVIPKKYLSAHYLSYRPTPNFSVGFYEAVLYSRERQLELQYLNPVIFYRTIEQGLASPDNVLIGLDFKWNLFKKVQLYGQLMLDEFKFDELILERRGWWGNKFGVQAGAKYIDLFGIDHLDVRLEWNMARPYTYTHFDSTANYTHTNQALAHPLGANFQEVLGTLRYQATKKLLLEARLIAATTGEDEEGTNWGIDLLRDYDSRELEIGNEIGQGVGAQMLLAGLDVTYQLYHNIFIDLNVMYRRFDSDLDARDVNSRYIGAGIRMNIGRQRFDF
ncbi:MAG: capsule assembly Wzi family protein [Bacteroidota bacterium]